MSNKALVVEQELWFTCPACKCTHGVPIAGIREPIWTWNKSLTLPTLLPSIRVRWEWVDTNGSTHTYQCHAWVKSGDISFCPDSTHPLAGKTEPLPVWE